MTKNWTINLRIAITIAFLGLLLIATGVLGILGMAESNQGQRDAYAVHYASVVALGKSGTAMSRARFGLDWAMSNPHSPQLGAQLERARALLADSDQWWTRFRGLPKTSELQGLTDDLDAKRSAVMRDGIDQLIKAIQSGDTSWMDESRANTLIGLYTAMNKSQGALEAYLDDAANDANQRASALFHTLLVAVIASIAIGLGVAVMSWRTLRRAIMSPLNQALAQFDAIAAGELTTRVPVHSNDEMGMLLRGLATMQDKLGSTITTVRSGSQSIASSTQQIAAGNLDLSQRTEEQAASLEQTASAMEQLTSTVQLNAENAQHASRLAVEASEMAARGRGSVGNMVDTMHAIHAGSSKMTGIIGAIEGIAFQTNILALNAAVEAARAGEEGRGFAVVAGEVRSLAQRSAAAAKEISGLIAESTSRVESGANLVNEAGGTMQQIEAAITRVAKLVGEIAAASSEQSEGIRQVSLAVTQMDEVTQQNAALVEESAATAASLAGQAARLNEVTGGFRV
ncbi:methyl-accepting chemotaxis protein [Paraburkholderia sp.]|uniref:methyl-accepting chemotaxis protein n=1 Tax=Paraburkholderia sp. TaxID=1926495 RepID=UPI002383D61B|nr:methyl-accepting chemotaxis protein [Paraburkholderia sp.]MDE1184219.1 methyl-accepting chemotaxis protein [Paraburkholderia sp.]